MNSNEKRYAEKTFKKWVQKLKKTWNRDDKWKENLNYLIKIENKKSKKGEKF